jgi:oxygen-independent coproporphyrinogen-3 oxidase
MNTDQNTHYALPPSGLIEEYSKKKGSFYSFYPMVGLWSESIGENSYSAAIDELVKTDPHKPIALYLHFPFCATQCLFCHCFTIISKKDDDHSKIVDYLIKEIDLLKMLFEKKNFIPNIQEVHFGGGSPSNMSRKNFSRLFTAIKSMSPQSKLLECALEIDPRYNIDREQLHFYADQGVSRISFGIQDFDKRIGKIINRINSADMIEELLDGDVRPRFKSINFDLIYGMPEQTLDSWCKTIDRAILLEPDRLAVYVFGFRPDLYPHMKTLEKYKLADAHEQMDMFVNAVNKFIDHGYEYLGVDHMSKPTDSLAIAKKNGRINRDAIGYSPGRARDILAIGPNSMSTLGSYYFQNYHTMSSYYGSIDSDQLPIVRGYEADSDDILRRDVIFQIILHSRIDFYKFEEKYDIESFTNYFAFELKNCTEMQREGLIILDHKSLTLTNIGRFFQRHVCRIFDKHDKELGYRYSRDFNDGKAAFDRSAQLRS